jgi:hypothetical protein
MSSEKVFFSLVFSNSLSSNSNSFPLNSKISEQQGSGCRGYYENWRPKIPPVDSVSYIRGRALQNNIIGVQKLMPVERA